MKNFVFSYDPNTKEFSFELEGEDKGFSEFCDEENFTCHMVKGNSEFYLKGSKDKSNE